MDPHRSAVPDEGGARPTVEAVDAAAPTQAQDALESACRDWLQAIAGQDERALAAFYDATVSRVYGLAWRILRSRADAEDVVVEVYWQVWREAGRYDPLRGKALTWLLTICRTRALDCLRRRDPAEIQPAPETLLEQVAADDTQDLLVALERDNALHAALATLTPLHRQLLALAFFRGLTHVEIAQQCALPLGSVKTHIRRALQVLREALPGHLRPGSPS